MGNFKKNLTAQSFIFFEKLIVQFFFPILMIVLWGKENFNLWIFFFSIPSFLSLFQISIAGPIRNELLIIYKNKKFKLLNPTYQNFLFIFLISILIFIFISISFLFLNIGNNIINENITIISIVIFCSLITLFCGGPLYVLHTYKGSLFKFTILEIIFDLLIPIAVLVSFYFLNNFTDVYYLLLLLYILKILVSYFSIKEKYIIMFFQHKFIKIKKIKKLIKLSLGFNFEILANIIRGPGLIFLLGISNNLSLTGMVSTLRTMFLYLPDRIFNIFIGALNIQILHFFKGYKFNNRFKFQYFKVIFYVLMLLIIYFLITYYFGVYIYNLWLNNKYFISSELVTLIVLDSIFASLGLFIILPFKAINKFQIIGLFDLLVSIFIFIVLYKFNIFNDILTIFKFILFGSFLNLCAKCVFVFYNFKKII